MRSSPRICLEPCHEIPLGPTPLEIDLARFASAVVEVIARIATDGHRDFRFGKKLIAGTWRAIVAKLF
jgi:hypothetical protein